MKNTLPINLPSEKDITRVRLENGITVLLRENRQSASMSIRGYLPGGSMLDPEKKGGLSSFMTSCLMRGTESAAFEQIFEQIESIGASINFSSDIEGFLFRARCLSEDISFILRIIQNVLEAPTFPENQLGSVRKQILTGLKLQLDSPEDMAELSFEELLFPSHPYGRSISGTAETILSISRKDIQDFHDRAIKPDGMILSIVGGNSREKTLDQVRETLGTWSKKRPPLPVIQDFAPPVKPSRQQRKHIEIPLKSEMALIAGTISPERQSPDYDSVILGNCILGQFGMMGRIGKVARDDNGLAYYVGSSVDTRTISGSWAVSAGTNPENTEMTLELIIQELRQMREEMVSVEELSDVKSYYIGSLPISLESNGGMATAILGMERNGFGLNYFQNYAQRINAVTRELIQAAVRKYIDPDKLIIVTAGTANQESEEPESESEE